VSLAIDDFGTGYSSLAYLKEMPIDVLKVDRAFVKDLPHGRNDCAITRTIIVLAQQLDLSVVAEGIELVEQANFLTESGCDIGQGFLYSRPLPLKALEEKLNQATLAPLSAVALP
ncbi:EAL domain-containing protein, partial [Oceanospirillum sp. HFRX-1_2]